VKCLLEGLVKALFLLNPLYFSNLLLFRSGFGMNLSNSVRRLLESISIPFCSYLNLNRVGGNKVFKLYDVALDTVCTTPSIFMAFIFTKCSSILLREKFLTIYEKSFNL
jgi:hypothetical protein